MISAFNNGKASVERWASLVIEARAVGANDAADALEVHVVAGRECLDKYPALAAAHDEAQTERDAAYKVAEAASASFNAGRLGYAEYQDAHSRVRLLDGRLREAWTAVITLLNRDIEQRERVALRGVKAAEAAIDNIAGCCLSGHGQEWHAANRDLDDPEAAAWEPVFIARMLKEYPKLYGQRSHAHNIAHLRKCFSYRAERRASRAAPPPNETIMLKP